jgi:hypothetical protein
VNLESSIYQNPSIERPNLMNKFARNAIGFTATVAVLAGIEYASRKMNEWKINSDNKNMRKELLRDKNRLSSLLAESLALIHELDRDYLSSDIDDDDQRRAKAIRDAETIRSAELAAALAEVSIRLG